MMAQYGRDTWRARGETFSVWFATLGRLAPLALPEPTDEDDRAPRPTAACSSGASGRAWRGAPGRPTSSCSWRSRPAGSSTTGCRRRDLLRRLRVAPVVTATALLAGWLILVAGWPCSSGAVVGLPALGAGLLPIAVGYLVAHYLTYLLFDGQRIVALVYDPLKRGGYLLGIATFEPNQLWLPAGVAWAIQLGAVVGGHVIGAWAGHRAAVEAATDDARTADRPATRGPSSCARCRSPP